MENFLVRPDHPYKILKKKKNINNNVHVERP